MTVARLDAEGAVDCATASTPNSHPPNAVLRTPTPKGQMGSYAIMLVDQKAVVTRYVEDTDVLRTLGEWYAVSDHRRQAADCFVALMQANRLIPPEQVAGGSDLLLPGPALLETGDAVAYQQFRQAALARFAGIVDPVA
jgi:hypothetical protein